MKGLIIDTPHVDNILSGLKSWEMRSTATKVRGLIALIRKGSGLVVGTADLVDSLGPLSDEELLASESKHLISSARVLSGAVSKWKHAWVLNAACTLSRSVAYAHPSGAVIWVNLDSETASSVRAAMK